MTFKMRVFFLSLMIAVCFTYPVFAQDNEQPIQFSSDRFNYNEKTGAYIAEGNVELKQSGRTLTADKVIYNQEKDTVKAYGNVSITDQAGREVTADEISLDSQFKNALIQKIQIKLGKNARLSARSAKREAGKRSELEGASFSPCRICTEKGHTEPIWKVKASRVIHDEVAQDITYHHAWMEFFGTPVLYVPYFFHPSPEVKRRSGFITPTFSQTEDKGLIFSAPYFLEIDDYSDITIEPILVSKKGGILASEFRQRFSFGEIDILGSVGKLDDDDENESTWRGHILSSSRFDLTESWQAGLNINRTSHRVYPKDYGFSGADILTSKAYVEGRWDRSYAEIAAYRFQGLRSTDDANEMPKVQPLMTYQWFSDISESGGVFEVETDWRSIERDEGIDTHRYSLKTAWTQPYISPLGDVYTLDLNVQGDAVLIRNNNDEKWQDETRIMPQASLNWRFPLLKEYESSYWILEPSISLTWAEDDDNGNAFPNEDSLGFVFDDTNLFARNRFSGDDRVTGGSRADYGVHVNYAEDAGQAVSAFIGQSYRLSGRDEFFDENSGLRDERSDIVGKFHYTPGSYADFLYRFRFNKEDFSATRNDISMSFIQESFWLNADYIYRVGQQDLTTQEDREQISGVMGVKMTEYWSVSANTVRSLEDHATRSAGIEFIYGDECLNFSLGMDRRFTKDRDLEQEDKIYLKVSFRNLGGEEFDKKEGADRE
ncbi:MAG: LPS-assembly protein LptD [Alphaproteobacteria bacterium]